MFFDREREREELWRLFEERRSVLMLAPRRIGKTELLHRLSEEAQGRGYRALFFDMEGYREEKDFLHQLCATIQEELGSGAELIHSFVHRFRRMIGDGQTGGDWRQLLLHTDWQEFAHQLLATLDRHEERWLILVDELPIYVRDMLHEHGREAVHTFLYRLRQLRQKYRNLRWLYTGSIGLDAVARREELEGALVDLEIYHLEPFAAATAGEFVDRLAAERGCVFEGEARDALLECQGWLAPYYLEKLTRHSCTHAEPGGRLTLAAVEAGTRELLALQHRTYWATWREHLSKNFNEPERTHLFLVLATAAADPAGVSRETLLARLADGEGITECRLGELLDTLEADGYLSPLDESRRRFRFRMGLLRLWWLRYVVGITEGEERQPWVNC